MIKDFSEVHTDDVSIVGGKGLSLGLMTQAGFLVPPGFVVAIQVSSAESIAEEILAAFDALGVERVAVRSSAVAEDSADASWAGQFESYLNVDRDGLLTAIQKCQSSVDAAQEYAKIQNVTDEQLAVAVVVQAMVDSEVSGVAFSVNPINHDTNEIMVEAIYGLGELIVQGMVTPDNYVLAKDTNEIISTQVATKTMMLVYQDGETKEVDVSGNQQTLACLDEVQLLELKNTILKIEDYYGSPQDIEWTYAKENFYIVQSRPITTL